MISIIVARARNGVIGADGKLPWRGQLPADMEHFRSLTMGHAVIMGRKTYLSIPGRFRPLQGRFNIVLSRNGFSAPCRVVDSLGTAIRLAQSLTPGEVFIIGGASVYAEALPLAERIYMTLVGADFPGDSRFPDLDEAEWQMTAVEENEADDRNHYPYSFVSYHRSAR